MLFFNITIIIYYYYYFKINLIIFEIQVNKRGEEKPVERRSR